MESKGQLMKVNWELYLTKWNMKQLYSARFSLLMAFAKLHSEFSNRLEQQLQCRRPEKLKMNVIFYVQESGKFWSRLSEKGDKNQGVSWKKKLNLSFHNKFFKLCHIEIGGLKRMSHYKVLIKSLIYNF